MIALIPIYLSAPPYLFSTDQVGLTFIASTIGQLIGACICGVGSDKLAEWSARRNGGVYEPEMRLPLIIIPTIAGPAGLLMFGIGLHNQAHWIVPVIGSALVGVNLTGFAAVVQPYLIDIYGPVISDVLVVSRAPHYQLQGAFGLTMVLDVQWSQGYCIVRSGIWYCIVDLGRRNRCSVLYTFGASSLFPCWRPAHLEMGKSV